MTDLQFSQYKKDIAGKKVEDLLNVVNVSDDGKLYLYGPWTTGYYYNDFCVVITGVPSSISSNINADFWIDFVGIVNGIVGDNKYYYNCEETLILKYNSLDVIQK